ncbi:MAG: D-alanine--D-alanine ligase [Spirochaetales bacterium]|uniref:D-alanine--D-alanine ligase n=1 Tax=Candidatus Thalassospirochaeta sargassi TaxID=3119039 RepID=A0AAJ1MJS6_9SPIO|nr:D-alanine--D-alanine ligase [Spirochaetales bacterium]
MKKNICVLYGGKSGEHEVSIRSASSVVAQLNKEKYDITLIGIDKKGRWYLQPDAEEDLTSNGVLSLKSDSNRQIAVIPAEGFFAGHTKLDIDFIFPVLHGTNGEDGTVQGLLELMEIPYAGADVLGSSMGMDKEIIKKVWISEGLETVPFISLNTEEMDSADWTMDHFIGNVEKKFGYPVFVKPVRAGSSVGISRADNREEFESALPKAFRFDNRVMIEPGIDAREIECSVIGNLIPEAYIPGEIAPTHEFYDYEAKYIDENGARLLIPAELDESTIEKVRRTAVKAYKSAGIVGMSRVDFFIDRKTGKLLLNEVNTIPGFTNISMFSKMCEAAGLPYPVMLDKLIELGEVRFKNRSTLDYSL